MDDMARVWPIIVQFGVGALLCLVGTWAGIASGYLDMTIKEDKRMVLVVIAGFVGLLLVSCAFTFWLPYLPVEAAP